MALKHTGPHTWHDEATGLTFRWNGSHTTNVYDGDRNVTMLSTGDFSKKAATSSQVTAHIRSWLRDFHEDIAGGRFRSRDGDSIKARWRQVREAEAAGHPMAHPRAFVYAGGAPTAGRSRRRKRPGLRARRR